MLEVKVTTGRTLEPAVAKAKAQCELDLRNKEKFDLVEINPGLHPSEICECVDNAIKSAKLCNQTKLLIASNNDHVFNRLRVLKFKKEIDDVEFVHFHHDKTGNVKEDHISVDEHGECSQYPDGFLDEWPHQMGQLAQI